VTSARAFSRSTEQPATDSTERTASPTWRAQLLQFMPVIRNMERVSGSRAGRAAGAAEGMIETRPQLGARRDLGQIPVDHEAGDSLLCTTNSTRKVIMATIVPLISSGTTGPLGVRHLPRLWQKVSLECRGKLAAGYPGIGKGYDQMVLDALGLKGDAVVDYIKSNRPTYPQFEAWIRQQPGVKLDKASIHRLNSGIVGYVHDDATRKSILGADGLADDSKAPVDAINLNNLDDWHCFWEAELK
jgi:hypothetical protein